MAVKLDYPPGATPLDADELTSLIPGHITTQGELNEWEQLNIGDGEAWAHKPRKDILDESFVRQLHHEMFGKAWRWAGDFRKSNKNIGVDWPKIGLELRNLRPEFTRPANSFASGGSGLSDLSGPARFSNAEVTRATYQPNFRLLQYSFHKGITVFQFPGNIFF